MNQELSITQELYVIAQPQRVDAFHQGHYEYDEEFGEASGDQDVIKLSSNNY